MEEHMVTQRMKMEDRKEHKGVERLRAHSED